MFFPRILYKNHDFAFFSKIDFLDFLDPPNPEKKSRVTPRIFFGFRRFGFCHFSDQNHGENVQSLVILSSLRIRHWEIGNSTSQSRLPVAFWLKIDNFEIWRFLEQKSSEESRQKSPDLSYTTSRDFFRDFTIRENPQNLQNSQISPSNRSKSRFLGQKSSFLKNRDFKQ